jgi:type II secretory pathway pseudopilin PulG
MEKVAIAIFNRRGFSIVELLFAMLILLLTGIAFVNSLAFFIHQKVKQTIVLHMVDAAKSLVADRAKLIACEGKDPCGAFGSTCDSSISCDDTACSDPNSCVVCYTNPDTGKKIFYSFSSEEVKSGSDYTLYKVVICSKYAGTLDNQTYFLHVRNTP